MGEGNGGVSQFYTWGNVAQSNETTQARQCSEFRARSRKVPWFPGLSLFTVNVSTLQWGRKRGQVMGRPVIFDRVLVV